MPADVMALRCKGREHCSGGGGGKELPVLNFNASEYACLLPSIDRISKVGMGWGGGEE